MRLPLAAFLLAVMVLSVAPLAAAAPTTISYSSVCNPSTTSIPAPSLASTIGITMLALSFAFDLIAIGYIIWTVTRASQVYNWVQGEYYELTKSIIIVVAIYGSITIVAGMAVALAPSSTGPAGGTLALNVGSLITSSESYLCTANEATLPGWTFIGQAAIAIGLVQNLHVMLYLPLPLPIPFTPGFSLNSGFEMAPYQNYMLESGNIVIQHFESIVFDIVQFVLFPVTSMLTVLISLLPLIVSLGLSVFIPLGLILRAFPFIRGMGGTLIAIGIAAAVLFPATLVLLDQPVAAWAAQVLPAPSTSVSGSCTFSTIICAPINAIFTSFGDNLGTIIGYAWDSFGGIYTFMNGMTQAGWYSLIQLILFALDLVIIYPLTDSIAKLLGGTIRLRLGGKLKMA